MCLRGVVICLFFGLSVSAFPQHLSVGLIGGASVAGDIESVPPEAVSTPKRYVVGAMAGMTLGSRVFVEVDGLYRPLHYTSGILEQGGGSPATVITWEIPVLVRYALSSVVFAEGGPAFRAAGNLNLTQPSHYGVTAGLGIQKRWGFLTLAPVLRYTHWTPDAPTAVNTASDEVEALLGVWF